jgi:hypothetical protein
MMVSIEDLSGEIRARKRELWKLIAEILKSFFLVKNHARHTSKQQRDGYNSVLKQG